MINKELTNQYYSQLNEAGFVDFLKLILPGLGSAAKIGVGAGAGLYGLDQLLDFGKDMMSIGSARTPQKDYGTERLKALTGQNTKQIQTGSTTLGSPIMSAIPKTAAEQKQDYIMSLQADKQLQGMPVSKRFTAIGKERAMAANINKAKMKDAKEAALQDPDYQNAMKKYQEAKKNEKASDRQASSLGAGYSESSKAVKDAHEAMVKARQNALSKSSEYKASSEAYASTTSGSLNLAKYDKNYSGFSVGRGVGGKPIITGGSYINPNSAEGRIEASIKDGTTPDLQRDPRTGRLDPTRSDGKLDDDAKRAGQAAYDKEIGFSTAGMSQEEIAKRVRERVKADSAKVLKELEDMPRDKFGAEMEERTLKGPQGEKYAEILRQLADSKPAGGAPAGGAASGGVKSSLTPNTSRFFPASPDRPKPGFGSMGRPTPATKDELIAKAALDIKNRSDRSRKDPSYQRRQQKTTTSDADIRGAGQEAIKNIGTLASKYRTQLGM